MGLVLLTACDRTETSVSINADGSGAWNRSITFTNDGLWAEDWDSLASAAADHEGDAAGFVQEIIPVLFPDLTESTTALATLDQALVEDFNLNVTTTETDVQILTSDTQSDFTALTGELALPGAFDVNAEGQARYQVDNMVATMLSVPGVGTIGSTGATTFTLEVPGTVLEHNAHEVDGQVLRWEWAAQSDEDALAEPTQGQVIAVWDPNSTDTTDGGGLRRIGLLGIAVLALAIGTAVLMTFRPPGFDDDDDYDDGYG